jgi:hypothetical protein
LLKTKDQLPYRVNALVNEQKEKSKLAKFAVKPIDALPMLTKKILSIHDDMSPYRLPVNHPEKTFISGYTGFVPRLQNHFGEVNDYLIKAIPS